MRFFYFLRFGGGNKHHFQFSLWDSKKEQEIIAAELKTFNSLYEIPSIALTTNGYLLITFNSLYEIQMAVKQTIEEIKNLSILFMRFSDSESSDSESSDSFQFSLWDSLIFL